mmetsp:Transcript_13850/g.31459  ORF Transcript_13850/g.31459 Transcript_13850/m.31459 type:complete len:256 (+) Transcript_13850:865-1632(+)
MSCRCCGRAICPLSIKRRTSPNNDNSNSNKLDPPPPQKKGSSLYRALLNRFRTYLMAWGTVNYWRLVWYIWDEFLGGATHWSCWIAHWGALLILTCMGCVSCIVAPASTLGIDLEPHPNAADEPLFDIIPVPSEKLVPLAIGRQPRTLQPSTAPPHAQQHAEAYISQSVSKQLGSDGLADGSTVEQASQTHWASGGTGARPGYSSARLSGEPAPKGYVNRQRPDMDRRVGSSELVFSLTQSQVSVRSTSSFHRNR